MINWFRKSKIGVLPKIEDKDMPPMPEVKPAKNEKLSGVEFLKAMQILSLQPGDIVVLNYPDYLSESAISNITNSIKAHIPDNKIIILEGGLTIGIIRKEDDISCHSAKPIED